MNWQSGWKKVRRYNEPGHAHALTFSCFRRQPFLSGDLARKWLVDAIDHARSYHHFHLWSWVIMPEHVHLLIWPTEANYSISRILSSLKQPVSRRALSYARRFAPQVLKRMEHKRPNGDVSWRFWQRGGGYDRNITESATLQAEVDYIHANPVRRGLCERPADWKWSSASEVMNPGSGPLSLDLSDISMAFDS